jgi:hypothetical protein
MRQALNNVDLTTFGKPDQVRIRKPFIAPDGPSNFITNDYRKKIYNKIILKKLRIIPMS